MTSEFQVGDEIQYENFQGSGTGIGVIKKVLKSDLPLKYHVLCEINHQNIRKKLWWFPLSKISDIRQPYDPLQNGDTEEDI